MITTWTNVYGADNPRRLTQTCQTVDLLLLKKYNLSVAFKAANTLWNILHSEVE